MVVNFRVRKISRGTVLFVVFRDSAFHDSGVAPLSFFVAMPPNVFGPTWLTLDGQGRKKRCIDSAFKVIKVPERPGQLVNEGRRKKGMMENRIATPKPRQQRRRSKWKEPWRFYFSIFYFKIY
ncbi:hypothetical protein Peur_072796 [Populus x canadensis]